MRSDDSGTECKGGQRDRARNSWAGRERCMFFWEGEKKKESTKLKIKPFCFVLFRSPGQQQVTSKHTDTPLQPTQTKNKNRLTDRQTGQTNKQDRLKWQKNKWLDSENERMSGNDGSERKTRGTIGGVGCGDGAWDRTGERWDDRMMEMGWWKRVQENKERRRQRERVRRKCKNQMWQCSAAPHKTRSAVRMQLHAGGEEKERKT